MIEIKDAVKLLKDGELIIYPTESFYALGCNALDGYAVAEVFNVKKRNSYLPLPVIIGNFLQVENIAYTDNYVRDLDLVNKNFWNNPNNGALSIILPAKNIVPTQLTGGTGKIAMRISSHIDANMLANSVDFPLVSSSANISGVDPVNLVEDLDPELLAHVPHILASNITPKGENPSTLIELLGKNKVKLVREGDVSKAQLQAYFVLADK